MARFRGVRPKGAGIEIRYQAGGERRSVYLDTPPTESGLADAARYRKRLIEQERLGDPEIRPATFESCCNGFLAEKRKSLKPSTMHGYQSKLEVYWSPLATKQIRTIRIADLKQIDRGVEWSSQKTRRDAHATLRRLYAETPTTELAEHFGRSLKIVYDKAKRLGLRKAPHYMREQHGARAREVGKATRFAPGQKSWNKGTHYIPGGRAPNL